MPLKLAFRNIFRNRLRSTITLLVIMWGCIAIIFTGGFIEDTMHQVQDSYIRDFLGHLRLYRKGFLEHGVLHPFDYLIETPDPLVKELLRIPHVRYASPRLTLSGLLSTGDATVSFIGQGIDPEHEVAMRNATLLQSGHFLEYNAGFEALIGRGLAEALDIKTGGSVVLLANTRRGAINALDATIKGIFSTADKGFDDHAVRIPLSLAQRLVRTKGVESIVIFLDQTSMTEPARRQITQWIETHHYDIEVKPWQDLPEADYITKMVRIYRAIFRIIKIVILTVVTLGIMNTMNMAMLERIGEIGTLMAMGTRRGSIAMLFVIEGFFLGALGGLLGCAGGSLLALLVSKIGIEMPTPPQTTIHWVAHIALSPAILWPAFGMAVFTALISSVLPAIKASRLEIAHALRYNI